MVPLLDGEAGSNVQFTTILAGGDENAPTVGAPTLSGSVSATILEHGKGDKVLVFKKKRRKGYRKLNGHRQQYTKIEIKSISL